MTHSFVETQGSRAQFHHLSLHNSTAKNLALDSISELTSQIYFGPEAQPSGPIPYTYTYVEWEANKVPIWISINHITFQYCTNVF